MQRIFHMSVDESRCSPQHVCLEKVRCLRYRCTPEGHRLGDFSCGPDGLIRKGDCPSRLALPADARAP
jgi:TPP-dependent indolepyruvate ferredoxin oxidoreductase alpha subunit